MWSRVVGSIVVVLASYVILLFHEMCPPEDLQTHLQQRSCVPASLPLKKGRRTILPFWAVAHFQGICSTSGVYGVFTYIWLSFINKSRQSDPMWIPSER